MRQFPFSEDRQWVEFGVFGAPRFSVQRSQNTSFKGFWDLWAQIRAPQKRQIQPRQIQPPFLGPLTFFVILKPWWPEWPNSTSSKPRTEFAQPGLSRSNGSHPQRDGTHLDVFGSIWLVLPQREATNLGVFDLCHFDLLKRGCANSGGFGAH